MGVFLALSTFFTLLAWSLPAIVLVAAALGAAVPGRDVRLAAFAFLLTAVARADSRRLSAISALDGGDAAAHGRRLGRDRGALLRVAFLPSACPLARPHVRRGAGAVLRLFRAG